MKKLTVLYDARCAFCQRCRNWLASQRAFVELELLAAGSRAVAERFPGLALEESPGDLVVVSDEGAVYRGPSAFIMCLWALVEYRELSLWLAKRPVLPLARRAFAALSRSRGLLSRLLARGEISAALGSPGTRLDGGCDEDACRL